MFRYEGKTALITGASSGIGAEFATALASRHVNLVMVARSGERLHTLATALHTQYGVQANVIPTDLSQPEAVRHIMGEIEQKHLAVDLLINNAGFGLYGAFETLPAERDHQQIMVDVAAVVALTHGLIPSLLMNAREAAILNVASMAAFQPIPYMAVYGASKAFMVSFSLALAEEYRTRGLRVITLSPGATDTRFFSNTGEMPSVGQKRMPTQVVETGLRALEHGRTFAVDGRMNDWMVQLTRLLPRQQAARIMERFNNPKQRNSVGANLTSQA